MSRSGYSDDCDNLPLWRSAVDSALKGKRGQAFLREMLASLDALPLKRLITGAIVCEGEYCALGAVACHRGTDVSDLDVEDRDGLADTFGIAVAMAAEIMYVNDEVYDEVSPEARFAAVRRWVLTNITVSPDELQESGTGERG